MSYVEGVKAMHRFEDSVKAYFGYLTVMEDKELQLCMAEMADGLSSTTNSEVTTNLQTKLELGELYYNQVRPTRGMVETLACKARRLLLVGEEKKYFENEGKRKYLEAMDNYRLQVEDQNSEYKKKLHEYRKKVSEWERYKSNRPFLHKLFGIMDPRPIEPMQPPKLPEPDEKSFIKESKKNGEMGKFLIKHTADYILSDIPPLDDVKKRYGVEKIKLLSFEQHNSNPL